MFTQILPATSSARRHHNNSGVSAIDSVARQLNLGKKEVEDAWNEGEVKWHEFEAKMRFVQQVSKDTAKGMADVTRQGASTTLADVKVTTELLMDEMRDGFERLRNLA